MQYIYITINKICKKLYVYFQNTQFENFQTKQELDARRNLRKPEKKSKREAWVSDGETPKTSLLKRPGRDQSYQLIKARLKKLNEMKKAIARKSSFKTALNNLQLVGLKNKIENK